MQTGVTESTEQKADNAMLRRVVERIVEALHPQKIIIFGSRARGDADDQADIDLLIIHETDLPRHRRYPPVRRLFRGMGVPMDILVYTPEEFARFQSVPGSLTYRIAQEGKVLYAAE